ncbi:MAG: aspartate aminotransferase family protein [Crocinitomicaceae bacterium]|nr:aspartate aminotransferase family protein [Crocinitomicaceae bacterium]
MTWKKLSHKEITKRVFDALGKNNNYMNSKVLGVPASYLDQEQFYFDAPFLKDAPFLSAMIANPNHIGIHTVGESEPFFAGTQEIEKELIELLATDVFKAQPNSVDGYVASGGTEANFQGIWIYRNLFKSEFGAKNEEIGVLFSEDAHYSVNKSCNILSLKPVCIQVDENTRVWDLEDLKSKMQANPQIKYWIAFITMSTTMFGSVDDPDPIIEIIKANTEHFKVHVDAAYGGFMYPFTNPDNKLSFENPYIESFSVDGHKMLQSPYGTGIFLCRKGLIHYTQTEDASYVHGTDFTFCGSRSGANAIAVWMIMMTYGYEGWKFNCQRLLDRRDRIASKYEELGIEYYCDPYMNIITAKAKNFDKALAKKYNLVADNYQNPKWWKIVVMTHVQKHVIDEFLLELGK